MDTRRAVFATLALAYCAISAHAEDLAQPLSARDWVERRVMGRFDAYAEVCTRHMAGAGGAWERALAGINDTVERVTAGQLATRRFAALAKATVPAAAVAQRLRDADGAQAALKARLESQAPFDNCPRFLRNAQDFGDNDLKPIVQEALAGFQSMLAPASPRRRK